MPFPLSFRGAFNYPAVGEPAVSPSLVADRIERAVRARGARNVERIGNALQFTGPYTWTAQRTNPLVILARGEVAVDPPPAAGGRGAVQYEFRTTKGLGILVGLSVAVELYVRAVGVVRLPVFAAPGLLVGLWAIQYTAAWLRVPLLLLRAAGGELEPAGVAPRTAVRHDAAT